MGLAGLGNVGWLRLATAVTHPVAAIVVALALSAAGEC